MPRSTGERQTKTNPARSSPPDSSPAGRSSALNRPLTDQTRAAETRNPAAPSRNTADGPIAAVIRPPSRGPTSSPRLRPTASVEFAHSRRWLGTRLGIAAFDAGRNGASASPTSAASAISGAGWSVNAIAVAAPAAASSEAIITRRRS